MPANPQNQSTQTTSQEPNASYAPPQTSSAANQSSAPTFSATQPAGSPVTACPYQSGMPAQQGEYFPVENFLKDPVPCNLKEIEVKLTLKKGQPITVKNTKPKAQVYGAPIPLSISREHKQLLQDYAVVIDEVVRFNKPGDDSDEPLDDDNSAGKRDGFVEAVFRHSATCGPHPHHLITKTEDHSTGETKRVPAAAMGPDYIKVERIEPTVGTLKKLITSPGYNKNIGGLEAITEITAESCGLPTASEDQRKELKAYVRLRTADEWYLYMKVKEGVKFKFGGASTRSSALLSKNKAVVSTRKRTSQFNENEKTVQTVNATLDGKDTFHGYKVSVKKDGKPSAADSYGDFADYGGKGGSDLEAARKSARKTYGPPEDQWEKLGREVTDGVMRFDVKEKEDEDKTFTFGVKWNGVDLDNKKVTEFVDDLQKSVNTTLDVIDAVYDAIKTAMSTGVPWTFEVSWGLDVSLFQGSAFLQVWNKVEKPITGPTYHLGRTKRNFQLALDLTPFSGNVSFSVAGIIQVIHKKLLSLSLTVKLVLDGSVKVNLPLFKNGDPPKEVGGSNELKATASITGNGTAGPYEITAVGSVKGGIKHSWIYSFDAFDCKWKESKIVSEAIVFRFKITKGNKLQAMIKEVVDLEETPPKPGDKEDPNELYVWPPADKGPKILLAKEYINRDLLKKV